MATATTKLSLDSKRIHRQLGRLTTPGALAAFMLARLPLALAAGVRLDQADERNCVASLPGGWRTRNPFGTTYWAAQGMAAELATGVHGMVYCQAAPVPVRMILAGCEGQFTRGCRGRSRYVVDQGDQIRESIERTLATGESLRCPVPVIGYDSEDKQVSEWIFTWAFKARLKK